MAAQKAGLHKIVDVSAPGQATPATSSRPVLVTNRPMIANDPMVTGSATPDSLSTAPVVNRQAKAVPISDKQMDSSSALVHGAKISPSPEVVSELTKPVSSVAETSAASATRSNEQMVPSHFAALNSDQKPATADETRQAELNQLITSGKYAVPINAVQRKRSQMVTLLLVLLAIVLALILVDALLDTGIIAISAIPHTHFFQIK